ncbi:hypothetical protein N0B31_02755 [Salinirubellus salinus]|uniref:Uncharacterized protein n=1 Tax=Salinirubellus salinus TaxID=1364945 RepID=A0A9E7R495_9EURY|nr:hypothetical protein [Salinirubellus salinus]UWM55211.1 hypothetical protein N0B31_02755 [Salinirubellus salinus]
MFSNGVRRRLSDLGRRRDELSPDDFETAVNSQGKDSVVATLQADAVLALMSGRAHPLKLAVPAYESFTTDGTADNTETFTLTHDIVDSPDTLDAVVWLDGTYYGTPDSIDYSTGDIDVTDSGTNSTVHVYYVSGKAATLNLRKVAADGNTREDLFTVNPALVHQTNQAEQPEFLTLDESQAQPFVAADMSLEVVVNAPYTVRYTDPDGDGTEPTNALLSIPVQRGEGVIDGLAPEIKAHMR